MDIKISHNLHLEPYSGPMAIPFDMGPVCLNYDERFVDDENVSTPTSLWNLTDEEWRGKLTFPSPVTSSPGRAFWLQPLIILKMITILKEMLLIGGKQSQTMMQSSQLDGPNHMKHTILVAMENTQLDTLVMLI